MCGEFDEEDYIDDQLFNRFLNLSRQRGVQPDEAGANAPSRLAEEDARSQYMTGLFQAGLTRAVNDANSLPQGERMDAVAGQAIVFARLAGFLAGHLPPGADVLRLTIEALMEGHREAAETVQDHHYHGGHEH